MHIHSISCGQGAPSMYLILLARQGVFPADVVIVADTGDEDNMLWSTGERTSARAFFEQVTKPLAQELDMDAAFVRSLDKEKKPLPDIMDAQRIGENGEIEIDIPLFGSRGGRLHQSCTDKWKKQAARQELRRRGAKTATVNLGLTLSEVHRVKPGDRKWETLQWPLIFIQPTHRAAAEEKLQAAGIPWLVRSQCKRCPHKDLYRWEMDTPEDIQAAASFEAQFNGEFFLTDLRIPLEQAIEEWRRRKSLALLDDICEQGYCMT